MQHNSNALIVVAKRPAPGKTKTRLSPPLTPELASALYECFLFDTLDQMRQVKDAQHVIAYLDEWDYFQRLAPDFELIPQEGHDLGSRLDNALTSYLSRGYERVVIMDSDSPTLPASHLAQAFQVLTDGADVVLGPCDDGGYYLIGVKEPTPRLLREVHMSTPMVAAETIMLAKEEDLHLVTLPVWYDIDDVSSLSRLIEEIRELELDRATHTRQFLLQNKIQHFMKMESRRLMEVTVIIPALNEAGNIGQLVTEIYSIAPVKIIVVDNGSTDATAQEAREAGAKVVSEPRHGYGYACAAGVAEAEDADVLAFLDGDHSFSPTDLPALLEPILNKQADLVLGSRTLGHIEPGAMFPQQRFGNWLAARLMNMLYKLSITDLGPYRAIRRNLLSELNMQEVTFGWPTEMIVKSAKRGSRIVEVPVSYRNRRFGQSKVSGTIRGTVLAGWYILGVTFRYAWKAD